MQKDLHGSDYMDLDDFEDLVLDKPEDEQWELINGRVVRSMVGARLDHARIIQNVNFACVLISGQKGCRAKRLRRAPG